jgi:putative ABC transport system ATP-binding protein
MKPLVVISELYKEYRTSQVTFEALRGVSLQMDPGDFVALMGPSGSGKSTLLHLAGGLDRPTAGSVHVSDQSLHDMDQTALAKFRRKHIGFIFQFFNLIENLSVQANVELPALLMRRKSRRRTRQRANDLLGQLHIENQAHKHPWELSGGQQQRVAIARALINDPDLLLADEPTGNLDSRSGQDVLQILNEFNQRGQTILMVTHDAIAAAQARQVIFIRDGQLADHIPGGDAQRIAQHLTDLDR